MPFVQIIIVTWNKKKDVLKLLGGLRELNYPPDDFAILVVDNGSNDGTAVAIEEQFPQASLLRHETNLGGSGGFNAGMRWALRHRSNAEYLWLLDNDALVDSEALSALVEVLEQHPKAALCGSRVMDIDHPEMLVEVGAFIDYRHGGVQRNAPDEKDLQDFTSVYEVDYVAACSLLARTAMVKKIGLWREEFFVYWDDMEWGVRCRAAGYQVLASNRSVVWHPAWHDRSVDHAVTWRVYYRTRNALCFFNHCTRGWRRRYLLSWLCLKPLLIAANATLNGHTAIAQAFVKAIQDFLRGVMGKQSLPELSTDGLQQVCPKPVSSVCLMRSDSRHAINIEACLRTLEQTMTPEKIILCVPTAEYALWSARLPTGEIFAIPAENLRGLALMQKLKLFIWLGRKQWCCGVTGPESSKLLALWGKPLIRMDWQHGRWLALEKINIAQLLKVFYGASYIPLRMLIWPPQDALAHVTKKQTTVSAAKRFRESER